MQSDESEPEEDSSSEASVLCAASAETVDSSNCDPHEPEAAAGVAAPDLAAILASPDITQVVSGDVNAPLVTIAIDEAALAPAVLVLRVPYLERLLEAVKNGVSLDGLAEAMRPAARQAHDDLATYLTVLVLALFDGTQLRSLQGPLAPFQALADATTVRRALLAEMRYVADVAASLPHDAYSTSGGLFRMIWRTCKGHALTLRLRTVYLYLPQPVAACLRAPPPGGGPPALAKVHVPETSPCTYLAAYWKADMSYTPTADFHHWCMARVRCGPLVLATCRNCAVCPNLPEHLQIPPLRLVVQLRPVLGAPGPQPVPKLPAATLLADLFQLGWRTELALQMPRERAQPMLAEIPLALRQQHDIAPPGESPLLLDAGAVETLQFYFLRRALRSRRHSSLTSPALGAWCLDLLLCLRLPRKDPGTSPPLSLVTWLPACSGPPELCGPRAVLPSSCPPPPLFRCGTQSGFPVEWDLWQLVGDVVPCSL